MAIYSIEEILNAVYSGTTLSGTASAAEILNTVFNGTDALQISGTGGGLADGTVDGNLVIWDDTAGEWVEATLTEAGLAPLAPSTVVGQLAVGDGAGGWDVATGISWNGSIFKIDSPGDAVSNGWKINSWNSELRTNYLQLYNAARIYGTLGGGLDFRPDGTNTTLRLIDASTIAAGPDLTTDTASTALTISGNSAYPSATVNLEGGDVTLKAGDGASGSAGLANGGDLHLGGGIPYGTGTAGDVIVDRGDLLLSTVGQGLVFGDGDTKIYESSDDTLFLTAGSTVRLMLSSEGTRFSDGSFSPLIPAGVNASATEPVFVPVRFDVDTGFSRAANNTPVIVAGGVPRYLTGTKSLTEATPINLFTVALAEDSGAAVEISFSVIATDGTTTELHSGKVIVDAINTNGTITSDVNHLTAQEGGLPLPSSIADSFSVGHGTNEFTIRCTMTSGLTTPTMNMYWTVHNNSPGTITVL